MKLFLLPSIAMALAAPALSINASGPVCSGDSGEGLKPMVQLKLQDLEGRRFDVSRLKGSILVLDFWATWCGPCISEIPRLNQLQKQYEAKGVKVVGVTMASGSAGEVKPFVSRHSMKYTILMGDDGQTYDLDIIGYPTSYLVTRDWKVYRKYVGAGPSKVQQIETDIHKLLGSDAAN